MSTSGRGFGRFQYIVLITQNNYNILVWISLGSWKAQKDTDDHSESAVLFQRLLIQRCHCFGYLHTHNPRG